MQLIPLVVIALKWEPQSDALDYVPNVGQYATLLPIWDCAFVDPLLDQLNQGLDLYDLCQDALNRKGGEIKFKQSFRNIPI